MSPKYRIGKYNDAEYGETDVRYETGRPWIYVGAFITIMSGLSLVAITLPGYLRGHVQHSGTPTIEDHRP